MQNLFLIDNKLFSLTGFSILPLTESGKRWPAYNSAQRVALFIGCPSGDAFKPIADVGTDVVIIIECEEPQEESDGDAIYDAVVMACHLFEPSAIYTDHGQPTLISLHRPTMETPHYIPLMAQWRNNGGEHVLYGSVSRFAVPPIENDPKI